MGLDWVSVALGIIVVLIFMAIFTMLRTMTEPFIKRFEPSLGQSLIKLSSPDNACGIQFQYNGRNYQLIEVNYSKKGKDKSDGKNYIFLQVEAKNNGMIRFRNIMQNQSLDKKIQFMLNINHEIKGSEVYAADLSECFKEIKVNASDVLKAKVFLSQPDVLNILTELKSKSGTYGLFEVIPLMIEPGRIILDYRLSETLINQLVRDPRFMKKHIVFLDQLAARLETV